jgi:uncharacterized membrane protein
MYTYRWLSLLVWLYFTEGVVRATSDSGLSAWLAGLQVLLCVAAVCGLRLHVRYPPARGRHRSGGRRHAPPRRQPTAQPMAPQTRRHRNSP